MLRTITSRSEVTGLHQWPGAPDRRAYLRDLHRHKFIITTVVKVDHEDRDVEFHDLGEAVETHVRSLGEEYHPDSTLLNFGAMSCEMLAHATLNYLEARGVTVVSVTVSEDGEHDGTVWA